MDGDGAERTETDADAEGTGEIAAVPGLRGPNAEAGLRGPNAEAGLRGPNAEAGLRGPNAKAGLRGPNAKAGQGLIRISWIGTALFVAVTGVALVAGASRAAFIVVCIILFLAGAAAFAVAYLIAVGRSRYDAIGMGGLFFLAGSAPRSVQCHLMGSFAVELVVALAAASVGLAMAPVEADNPLAFGILTPLYGLGIAGLWGARHGTFAPRRLAGGAGGRPSAGVAGDVEGSG